MRRQRDEESSRAFYDLSALVLSLLRSPPMPISLPDHFPDSPVVRSRRPRFSSSLSMAHISPSGFAWLLLGVSVALMLCGSVTFFIGFLLLPWVLALIVVFYVVGIVSAISMAGRSILCYVLAPPSPPRKEVSGKFRWVYTHLLVIIEFGAFRESGSNVTLTALFEIQQTLNHILVVVCRNTFFPKLKLADSCSCLVTMFVLDIIHL